MTETSDSFPGTQFYRGKLAAFDAPWLNLRATPASMEALLKAYREDVEALCAEVDRCAARPAPVVLNITTVPSELEKIGTVEAELERGELPAPADDDAPPPTPTVVQEYIEEAKQALAENSETEREPEDTPEEEPTKTCTLCPEKGPQPLSAFSKNKSNKTDGHSSQCKSCYNGRYGGRSSDKRGRPPKAAKTPSKASVAMPAPPVLADENGELKPFEEARPEPSRVSRNGNDEPSRDFSPKVGAGRRPATDRNQSRFKAPSNTVRLCSRKRLCLSFPQLGSPTKLSAANPGPMCIPCTEARRNAGLAQARI